MFNISHSTAGGIPDKKISCNAGWRGNSRPKTSGWHARLHKVEIHKPSLKLAHPAGLEPATF
jgi:hypothetical protein